MLLSYLGFDIINDSAIIHLSYLARETLTVWPSIKAFDQNPGTALQNLYRNQLALVNRNLQQHM